MARRTTKSSSGTSKTAAKSRAKSTRSAGRSRPSTKATARKRSAPKATAGKRSPSMETGTKRSPRRQSGARAHQRRPGRSARASSRARASRLPSRRSSRRPRSQSWPGAQPSPGSPSSRPAWRSSPSIAATRWATAWSVPESGLASWAATSSTPVTPRRTSATHCRNSTRRGAIGLALNAREALVRTRAVADEPPVAIALARPEPVREQKQSCRA